MNKTINRKVSFLLNRKAEHLPVNDNLHIVYWCGGSYILQRVAPKKWYIRRRGSVGIIAKVEEKNCLGLQEIISWVEDNI